MATPPAHWSLRSCCFNQHLLLGRPALQLLLLLDSAADTPPHHKHAARTPRCTASHTRRARPQALLNEHSTCGQLLPVMRTVPSSWLQRAGRCPRRGASAQHRQLQHGACSSSNSFSSRRAARLPAASSSLATEGRTSKPGLAAQAGSKPTPGNRAAGSRHPEGGSTANSGPPKQQRAHPSTGARGSSAQPATQGSAQASGATGRRDGQNEGSIPANASPSTAPGSSSAASAGGHGTRGRGPLALDVEYSHWRTRRRVGADDGGGGARRKGGVVFRMPAEVCLVDEAGRTVFHCMVHPGAEVLAACDWVGGVGAAGWQWAPSLADVSAAVAQLIAGRVVVGHGLRGDLGALRLGHPSALACDTRALPALQSRRHAARRLGELTASLLGRRIQATKVHSAREDAVATMELYLRFGLDARQSDDYDALVQRDLAAILTHAAGSQ